MQKSMTESNSIPTLYLKDEFDLTALVSSEPNILERNQGRFKTST